ncbi:MAG: histidine kinase dimerization/phospho-acceptor domain-containing protein [Candidatus Acidiferrales bacterium]
MYTGARTATVAAERTALLLVGDKQTGQQIAREMERFANPGIALVEPDLSQFRERLRDSSPRVILLDQAIVGGTPLRELLRQLTESAPVVLLGVAEQRADIWRLIAEGDLDFVARRGDFAPLAASLIERRLRWAERSESALGPPWAGLPVDASDILRHEINNPLTGILGNAELLLAHRDRLPAADTQRLQTVVDLAVRLRETTRRLSNALETHPPSRKSA